MHNKENTSAFGAETASSQDFKPKDSLHSNPLVALNFENRWESSWDASLQNLVVECSFDFDMISSRLNKLHQTTAFNPDVCRRRWGEIHKQRKQGKNGKESDKEKMDRIIRLSAPPTEDDRKTISVRELEEALPVTRTKRDFLDPNVKEFDKKTDTTIMGEDVQPSGKFKIRT